MSKKMSKILVVLESPNKEAKVQDYLGDKYLVTSSKGHIRDLDAKSLSINIEDNFSPKYFDNDDKEYVIKTLKRQYKQCHDVLLATDYDREGESIAWHVAEVLGIKVTDRKRLLFQEITKKALQKSLENVKPLDLNMFDAQQARRIIDRLIGYKWLSPLLWKNVQNSMKKGVSLSGGRVQSVVNRLIICREKEIEKFTKTNYFKTKGIFKECEMDLEHKFEKNSDVEDFIDLLPDSCFIVESIKVKKSTRKPSTPFITSTLQQEASNKWRMSPKNTMMFAQKLYENGLITYMRTDSVTISDDILKLIKRKVVADYGEEYSTLTQYKNKSSNSQEAHEAIRPSDINKSEIKRDDSVKLCQNCVKLYNLIWRRTIASQMSPAKVDIQTLKVGMYHLEDKEKSVSPHKFISKNDKIVFDGFLKVYNPVKLDEDSDDENTGKKGVKLAEKQELSLNKLLSEEKFTKPPIGRFTEASLVKKLDEMGIGRPSTYSSMVSIVQDRNFAKKKDVKGEEMNILKYSFDAETCELEEKSDKITVNGEKDKLVPTDIGTIVNSYLENNISDIVSFDFTVNLEKLLDEVSTGDKTWTNIVRYIYDMFEPRFCELMAKSALEKDKHKKILGKDPSTNRDIVCYIGQYGPVVKLTGDMSKKIKDRYCSLKDTKFKLESITLDNAIALFKYPLSLGKYNGKDVQINIGKFGLYFKYDGKNYSLKDKDEPETIDDIEEYFKEREERSGGGGNTSFKKIEGLPRKINDSIYIKTGRYGPYIQYKKNPNSDAKPLFISIGKADPLKINKSECMALINKRYKK